MRVFLPDRRRFLISSAALPASLSALGSPAWAADAPTADPLAGYKLRWTSQIKWANVVDVAKQPGADWDEKFATAQMKLASSGGGVVWFPAGTYRFQDHLRLLDGVVIRGDDPQPVTRATEPGYQPATRFEFPRYEPGLSGDGTPIDSAFKGIYLANPAGGANTGVVNVALDRGHIHLGEADGHRCEGNRVVFGCLLANAAVADPRVLDESYQQHAWQRFTHRHRATTSRLPDRSRTFTWWPTATADRSPAATCPSSTIPLAATAS